MNVLDSFRLDGKAAIVTGAGRGLGRAIAAAFAQAGADVFGVGTTADAAETKKAVEENGRRFVWFQADLSSPEPARQSVDAAFEAFGHVDILVNNAGIIRREDSVNFLEKDWDEVMNVNLKSVFFLCQAAGKKMIDQNGGKIINIASLLSFQGGIRVPSYTASKGGVKTLTMLLANEWAKYNINVNAIAPGYMETDNTAALRADGERSRAILDRIPAGRWGKPEDLAGAAVFLASKASDYMNGFTVAVDGGWLAR